MFKKKKLHDIIFYSDTKSGKLFDVLLLWVILISITLVMLESVATINLKYGELFNILEWIITLLFLIEYILRIYVSKKPLKYIFSGLGIIDLLSLLPKFLSYFLLSANALIALRALRLLRVFRILKLARYISESNKLINALKASRVKISVFLMAVIVICIILGTLMYLIEGAENGFTSIPRSVYWCIVTLTTVGFGDIAPSTPLGQLIAALIMIIGYGVIAVPTGIVTAEFSQNKNETSNKITCQNCDTKSLTKDAIYCHNCGEPLKNE